MRIAAGKVKGKKLYMGKKNTKIRPTGAKTKEAIFNIIQARIKGAFVLDLFCGTGNLGLEALSQGAKSAVFIDNHSTAYNITWKNLKSCEYEKAGLVFKKDVFTWLKEHYKDYQGVFHIIFADPPYQYTRIREILENELLFNIISEDGILILEHAPPKEQIFKELHYWRIWQTKRYGQTMVTFFVPYYIS